MSKTPKIKHEYHADKDKLKITISGYALGKKARHKIMERLIADVERKPDRLISAEKKSLKSSPHKTRRGQQKETKLIEVGD